MTDGPLRCVICNRPLTPSATTEEHFIPRSMGVPASQVVPACTRCNGLSNKAFDSVSRDLLFWAHYAKHRSIRRVGEVLRPDGSFFRARVVINEDGKSREIGYVHDVATNRSVDLKSVCAVRLRVGLSPSEMHLYFRFLAKVSVGALYFLLHQRAGVSAAVTTEYLQLTPFARLREFIIRGRADLTHIVISQLKPDELRLVQSTVADARIGHHVVAANFFGDGTMNLVGMLFSQYGWRLGFRSDHALPVGLVRLVNEVPGCRWDRTPMDPVAVMGGHMVFPNPLYVGEQPPMPDAWGVQQQPLSRRSAEPA